MKKDVRLESLIEFLKEKPEVLEKVAEELEKEKEVAENAELEQAIEMVSENGYIVLDEELVEGLFVPGVIAEALNETGEFEAISKDIIESKEFKIELFKKLIEDAEIKEELVEVAKNEGYLFLTPDLIQKVDEELEAMVEAKKAEADSEGDNAGGDSKDSEGNGDCNCDPEKDADCDCGDVDNGGDGDDSNGDKSEKCKSKKKEDASKEASKEEDSKKESAEADASAKPLVERLIETSGRAFEKEEAQNESHRKGSLAEKLIR